MMQSQKQQKQYCFNREHYGKVWNSSTSVLVAFYACMMPMDSTSPVCTSEAWVLQGPVNFRSKETLHIKCNPGSLLQNITSHDITLASKHQVIERAFGLLKKRFPGLRLGIDIADMDEINAIIVFACVLYNMGIREDNPNQEDQDVLFEKDDIHAHTGPRSVDPQSRQHERHPLTNSF